MLKLHAERESNAIYKVQILKLLKKEVNLNRNIVHSDENGCVPIFRKI